MEPRTTNRQWQGSEVALFPEACKWSASPFARGGGWGITKTKKVPPAVVVPFSGSDGLDLLDSLMDSLGVRVCRLVDASRIPSGCPDVWADKSFALWRFLTKGQTWYESKGWLPAPLVTDKKKAKEGEKKTTIELALSSVERFRTYLERKNKVDLPEVLDPSQYDSLVERLRSSALFYSRFWRERAQKILASRPKDPTTAARFASVGEWVQDLVDTIRKAEKKHVSCGTEMRDLVKIGESLKLPTVWLKFYPEK
jgi:hypothetical protein